MATYTWNGTDFGASVATRFLTDGNGNFFFYEKNYNAFFHVIDPSTTGNLPVYAPGDSNNFTLIPGQILNSLDQYVSQIITFNSALLIDRMNSWVNLPTNIFKDFTQNPSALVASLLNTGAGNSSVFSQLNALAPVLVDKSANFALQEVLNKWPDGQKTIQNLNKILLGFQAKVNSATQSTQSILDFKTKLIRQSTKIADETSKLQQQAHTFLTDNTFTALVSAFPQGMGPIASLIANADAKYASELATLLPSVGLSGTSIQGIVNGLFGGKIPIITCAVDKLFGDINELQGGFNDLVKSFPTNGFHSIQDITSVCNQSVNLLNNLLIDLPLQHSVQIPNPVTDALQIVNVLEAKLAEGLGEIDSQFAGAVSTLGALIAMNTTTLMVSASIEPFIGGSLAYTAALSGVLHGQDPSMTTPNLTASPDPTIASKQVLDMGRQTYLDAQGKPLKAKRGQCINSLEEFPLRPRNTTLDGSPGTYNVSAKIDY